MHNHTQHSHHDHHLHGHGDCSHEHQQDGQSHSGHDHHACGCGHDHDHHDHHHGYHHHHETETASAPLVLADLLGVGAFGAGAWDVIEDDYQEPPFTEFTFSHKGVGWHVSRWGNAADMPLVMLHGFMQTAATWNFFAPELAQNHCVYALDFVGHGQSDKPDDAESYTYDAVVEAIEAFLRDVACVHPDTHEQRKAHILGYSMGGRVAAWVAARNPNLVYSVILESCNFGPVDEEEREAAKARTADWVERLRRDGIDDFVSFWEELPLFATQKERALDAQLRPERTANDANALALCLEGMGKHAMPLEGDLIGSLTSTWLPLKYLCGSHDPSSERLARLLGREGFDVTTASVGHNVHLEAPMAYLGTVRQFLEGIELRGL